jgi:histidine triad (HIT) family protein
MYDKNNIFAKIIRGEIPCTKVYEDETILAFNDITPSAPTHILVVPKGEYISLHDFSIKACDLEIAQFFRKVTSIAESLNLEKNGYRIITNHGSHAHQSVPHFHVHILGGGPLGGLLSNRV